MSSRTPRVVWETSPSAGEDSQRCIAQSMLPELGKRCSKSLSMRWGAGKFSQEMASSSLWCSQVAVCLVSWSEKKCNRRESWSKGCRMHKTIGDVVASELSESLPKWTSWVEWSAKQRICCADEILAKSWACLELCCRESWKRARWRTTKHAHKCKWVWSKKSRIPYFLSCSI